MANYKTGQHEDFFWIEFFDDRFNMSRFFRNCSDILKNKYLAVICFDSGPLRLSKEEEDLGWFQLEEIAYSPEITDKTIDEIPYTGFDQWCLFNNPTKISNMTDFVNYSGFSLTWDRPETVPTDQTMSKEEQENKIKDHKQIAEQFWNEVTSINPVNLISDGHNFIFISKNKTEIEIIEKSTR